MSRHASRTVRRLPVLVLVPAALLVGGLADRIGAKPSAPATNASVQPVPVAPPAGAYSSSWFCAGMTGHGKGQIAIYDVSAQPETATITAVSDTGKPTPSEVQVQPGSTTTVSESLPSGANYGGAIVDVDGSAAVEQILDSSLGRSLGECATSGSNKWYLPTGQTRVNASETILMMNPYPTDSIVDLSFTTDQGVEQPQDFQGIDVPPDGLVAIPLGSHLRRRASIASSISARSGSLVAWSEEMITPPTSSEPIVGTPQAGAPLADPAAAVPGISLSLGAPDAGLSWEWPDGLAGDGVDEQYVVYNPGTETADVSLAIGLQEGSAEPFQLTVGPGQVVPVISEQQARIPSGAPHVALLTSTNGVPVVAARAATGKTSSMAGIASMLGEQVSAADWVVPWSATDSGHQGQLIVENPGRGTASVTVTVAGQPVTESVGPGGRWAVAVTPTSPAPVTVTASQPIYAEYDLYHSAYSLSSAIPLS